MTKEEHRNIGISYFNKTWELLDKPSKTTEDAMLILDYAHASKLHWVLSEPPVINIVRGIWLISHVYAVLGIGESALLQAQYCLDETMANEIGDFDLVFAYEAMARALFLVGNHPEAEKYLQKGYEALDKVEKIEDKTYCKQELDALKNT
jgi:hypothetical protein